jgi:hypothetical protein
MKFKIIAIIMFISLSVNSECFFAWNQGCKAFSNQCDEGDGVSTQALSLCQLIIEAAGHFLQSNSDYQLVLKRIELSETGLIDSIDKAIQSMSAVNEKYFEIWETSLSLEYDPIVIEKLSQFDFTEYQIENNLNPVIFQRVEGFLKQGHVRELFQQAYIDTNKILEKLKEIQTTLESGKKVDISNYWRLNQLYLDYALFGQYCSEVFIKM